MPEYSPIVIRTAAAPLFALALLLCERSAFADTAPATGSPPDANALFGSLRSNLAGQTYPAAMSYAITVHVVSNGAVRDDHYDGELDGTTGEFRVRQFSREEDAHPYVPHGINVVLMLAGGTPIVLSKQVPAEPFGVPNLSPMYSFGLRRCPRPSSASGATSNDAGLKQIGVVVSTSRVYTATLAGDEMIDGINTTHLALVPLTNPAKNRLRDVWIDSSNNVVRARVSGNFTTRATQDVTWLLRFRTTDGSTLIENETAEAPIIMRHHTYDDVSITFSAITTGSLKTLEFALPKDSTDGGLQEPGDDGQC